MRVIRRVYPLRRISIIMNNPMDVGQTYSYYYTREYLPTLIFSVLCVALSLLLIPVQLLLKESPILKRYFKTEFFIKLVFSTMLNKHRDRNGKKVYTILDYKVSIRYKVMMLAVALSLIGIAGGSFWYHFLFEKSHICSTDPDLACFPAYPNMTTPRLDCSDTSYLEERNITSVICYRYAYNLTRAIGSGLGLIAVNALFTIIITVLLLKVSNGSEWTKCTLSCSTHCSYSAHYGNNTGSMHSPFIIPYIK